MKLASMLSRAWGESMKSTRIKREESMKLASMLSRAWGESIKSAPIKTINERRIELARIAEVQPKMDAKHQP